MTDQPRDADQPQRPEAGEQTGRTPPETAAEETRSPAAGGPEADPSEVDADLQQEIEAALGDMSLDEIIEAEEAPADRQQARKGVRQGRVIGIHGDDVFVYFGGKTQGVLPAEQFEDEPLPKEGDTVEVTVEGYDEDDGLLLLSRKGAVLEATWDSLTPGAVVEGRVTGLNKGGLELDLSGIRAFMPISQVELGHVEDLTPYLNEKLRCEVQEVDRAEKNVVVSRRKLLAAEAEQAKKQTLSALKEGDVVTGTVKTLMPYGAFVDIGGVDGLLHVSDMSHAHVDSPGDVCKKGDQLDVKVLKIDSDGEKISLGLKQTQANPWDNITEKYHVDEMVSGRVTRLMDFGAFVELEPGVEGLVPISELTYERRVGHPREILEEGQTIQVKVMRIEPGRQRMSLSLKQVGDDPWMGASTRWPQHSVVEGRVTRITDFGAFVEVAPGVEGLIHISQLREGHVRDVHEVLRVGDPVRAVVLNVDEDARRMGLSLKAMHEHGAGGKGEAAPLYEPPRRDRKRKRKLKGGLD